MDLMSNSMWWYLRFMPRTSDFSVKTEKSQWPLSSDSSNVTWQLSSRPGSIIGAESCRCRVSYLYVGLNEEFPLLPFTPPSLPLTIHTCVGVNSWEKTGKRKPLALPCLLALLLSGNPTPVLRLKKEREAGGKCYHKWGEWKTMKGLEK